MKYLLVLLFVLTGCGKHEVKVSGDVDVHHKIELTDVRKYFIAECTEENPAFTQEEIDTCADAKVGNFLSVLYGGE